MMLTDAEIREFLARPNNSPCILMVQLQEATCEEQNRLCPLVAERLLSSYQEVEDSLFLCLVFSKRRIWDYYLKDWQAPRCLDYHSLSYHAVWHNEFDALMWLLRKSHLQYNDFVVVSIFLFAFRHRRYDLAKHFAYNFFRNGLKDFDYHTCIKYKNKMSKYFIECATESWHDLEAIECLNSYSVNHLGQHHSFLYNVVLRFYKKGNTKMVRELLEKQFLWENYIFGFTALKASFLPGILAIEGASEQDVLAACENTKWKYPCSIINRYVLLHLRERPYPKAFSFLCGKMEPHVGSDGYTGIRIIFKAAVKRGDIELLQWLKKCSPSDMFENAQKEFLPLMVERLDATIVAEMMMDVEDSTKFCYSLLTKNIEMFRGFLDKEEIINKINIFKYLPDRDETFLRLFFGSFSSEKLSLLYQNAFIIRDDDTVKFIESLLADTGNLATAENFSCICADENPELFETTIVSLSEKGEERGKILKENFRHIWMRFTQIPKISIEARLDRLTRYLDELDQVGECTMSFIMSQIDPKSIDFEIEELELFYERGLLDIDLLLAQIMELPNNKGLVIASFLLSKGAKMPPCSLNTSNGFVQRLLQQYNIEYVESCILPSTEIFEFLQEFEDITSRIGEFSDTGDKMVI